MLGDVGLASLPEPAKHDGELSCHRHHRSLLRILPSTVGQLQAPAAEIAVGAKGAKDVLGAANKETTEKDISGLACPVAVQG